MKSELNLSGLAALAAVAFCCVGCGGISASPSVSPATFLLPGLVQAQPKQAPPQTMPSEQDSVQPALTSVSREVAQAR